MNRIANDGRAGEQDAAARNRAAKMRDEIRAREPRERPDDHAGKQPPQRGNAPTGGSARGNEISSGEQHAVEDHQRIDRVRHHDRLSGCDDRDAVEDRKREQHAGDALLTVPA